MSKFLFKTALFLVYFLISLVSSAFMKFEKPEWLDRLRSNDPSVYSISLADSKSLNEAFKIELSKTIAKNNYLGNVIWHKDFDDDTFRNEISDLLIRNNFNFNNSRFPSHLEYALLSSHVYLKEKHAINEPVLFGDDDDISAKYQGKLKNWKIKKIIEFESFYSVLYENSKTAQLVLAFKGTGDVYADVF